VIELPFDTVNDQLHFLVVRQIFHRTFNRVDTE
jgi:hypothetical protein